MFPYPYSQYLPPIDPAQITRLPNSLELTDDVFLRFSSKQILNIILQDIQQHSQPLPQIQAFKRKLSKKQRSIMPQFQERKDKDTREKVIGCNCRKSKCLKLYCDCFSAGEYCKQGCGCEGCSNTFENMNERVDAVASILEKQPNAFLMNKKDSFREKEKGCCCRRSGCRKKYCDCFAEGIQCTKFCKCEGCQNCKQVKGGSDKKIRRTSLV